MTEQEIIAYLKLHKEYAGYIIDILEDDYGCEERQVGEELKVITKILTESGMIYRKITDNMLTENKIDVGGYIPLELWKEFV